jgi:long-subunit acyl-CoA synthetase (AMP-forming)
VVPDVSIKRSTQGELLVWSPGNMLGYYGDSDLTDLVIDQEGYYRTGDLGMVDETGYLQILGRRRDVFNTPEGSNIYPERVEIMLESIDWVEQVFLVGDGKPYITAHIVVRPGVLTQSHANTTLEFPDCDSVPWSAVTPLTRAELAGIDQGMIDCEDHPEVYTSAGATLAQVNQRLELVEQIVAFALYEKPFDSDVYRVVTAGKVQRDRAGFVRRYGPLVERLYSNDLERESPLLVPPRERRYRLRTAPKQQEEQPLPLPLGRRVSDR